MKLKTIFWLVSLALLWGIAFLFVKVAVQDIPPLTLVTGRVGGAALMLYLIMRAQNRRLPAFGSAWLHCAVVGLLYNAAPYALLAWAQQYIDSALAAMFIGVTPLFTMVLAHWFTADDHFTPAKVIGIVLGFGGLVVLLAPEMVDGVKVTSLGLLAALVAAASYGGAIVYAKQKAQGLPPLAGPTIQLTSATIFLLPPSLVIERPLTLPWPSWTALGALLMLAIFSTALAFFLYYRAMETTSATTLSMATYLVPVVATIVGVVVLNEQLVWSAYLGFALVILGIVTVNGWFNAFDWSRFSQRKENLPMITNKMERLTETIVDRLRVKQFGVEWLQQNVARHTFNKALTLAYAAWMPDHQSWGEALFDKYFLTHRAAPLLTRVLTGASLPEPAELVQLWAEQFTWFNADTKQRHIKALIPAAAHFLQLLETRLRRRPEFFGFEGKLHVTNGQGAI